MKVLGDIKMSVRLSMRSFLHPSAASMLFRDFVSRHKENQPIWHALFSLVYFSIYSSTLGTIWLFLKNLLGLENVLSGS